MDSQKIKLLSIRCKPEQFLNHQYNKIPLNSPSSRSNRLQIFKTLTINNQKKFTALRVNLEWPQQYHQEASIDILHLHRTHVLPQSEINIFSNEESQQCKIKVQQQLQQNVEFNPEKNYKNYSYGNLRLREGYIQRDNICGFTKIYVVLTKEKIFEYPNHKKLTPTRIINFASFRTRFVVEQLNFLINLNFIEISKCVQYKIDEIVDFQQWIKCFQSVFSQSLQHIPIAHQQIQRYINDDLITETQLLQIAETGDLLLFETNNVGAQIQRVITNSRYDHVAIIFRVSPKHISIFDSNADTGVSFVEWNTFMDINDLYSKVVLRKLIDIKDRKAVEMNLFMFLNSVHGNKYQMSAGKLLRNKSLSPRQRSVKPEDNGYFCSELVAQALKKCQLLQCDKASSSFWPGDFAQEKQIRLSQGVFLERELTVVLNKHCYKQ